MGVVVTVFGPEPPCTRCQSAKKNAEKAAANLLKTKDLHVKVQKANIASEETIRRYGILVSPALAINGTVKFMGRIPSEGEIEKEILKAK